MRKNRPPPLPPPHRSPSKKIISGTFPWKSRALARRPRQAFIYFRSAEGLRAESSEQSAHKLFPNRETRLRKFSRKSGPHCTFVTCASFACLSPCVWPPSCEGVSHFAAEVAAAGATFAERRRPLFPKSPNPLFGNILPITCLFSIFCKEIARNLMKTKNRGGGGGTYIPELGSSSCGVEFDT